MRRLQLKIILALTIVPLLLSSCETLANSTQSFGRAALGFVGLSPAVSVFEASAGLTKALQNPSNEEEYHLGRAVAAQILGRYSAYDQGEALNSLNLLGNATAGFSDRPEIFDGYHFFLLKSDQINAMAAPGGFVFITSGMVRLLSDEDSLAAILAHEIAHIELQHGIKSIQQSSLDDALQSLGSAAGSVQCAQVMQQTAVLFDAAVGDIVGSLLEKGYSREQEMAADQRAVQILSALGYKSDSLNKVLVKLHEHESSAQGGWFSTHPSPQLRLEAINELTQSVSADNLTVLDQKYYQARQQRFLNHILSQL